MDGSTTLVTALYDIGRDNLKGKNAHRSFTKYLNWFKNLLLINVPMVIFIPKNLYPYILEHRPPNYLTKIIIREFEDLNAYKYHDRIQSTIDKMVNEPNSDGTIPSYFSECPEFITAKYEVIIYSKFDFLHEVANDNPHNTNYFIWLDAGTFYQETPFNYKLPWPDPYKIQILGDKFLVSDYKFNVNNMSPLKDKKSYLRLNNNEICAFILGGTIKAINKIHTQFWDEVDNAINMGVINNEQHILQLMVLERPHDYYIWYRTRYQYPKLSIPLRDRMIPCELALGTFIKENYPINNNIKVLTVATKEISKMTYERWETTAIHFGYNYEILGREESWKGFGTKFKLYYKKLKTVTEPYTVLTDCTDLFFCGSSQELFDKFIRLNKDIIVGGEPEVWYRNGKQKIELLQSYFNKIKQSSQVYPNSGFIMGKTNILRNFLELYLDYKDDQAACFDAMYEDKAPITIDYNTTLVANIPGYKNQSEVLSNFTFDTNLKRYKNIKTGELPVIFHFPGNNKFVMQEFYIISQPDLAVESQSSNTQSGWVFLGIIFILFIILMIIYLSR